MWIVFYLCLFNFKYFISVNLVVVKMLGKAGILIVSYLVEKRVFVLFLGV